MTAQINQKAPLLAISDWVQGEPVNFDQLTGKVVLVEFFQVNCPGCFLYALPQAIALYQRFSAQGLVVLGVATAFEDFEKNNLENLMRLVKNAEVIGETRRLLSVQGKLIEDRLPYKIPFPVAMDRLHKRLGEVTDDEIAKFIRQHWGHFEPQSFFHQQQLHRQVAAHLKTLEFHAETFECFNLKGTPSQILVDKSGRLRVMTFGFDSELESHVIALLNE